MQEKDITTNAFVEQDDRFADIFNGGFYDGNQVINPNKLKKMDRTSGTLMQSSNSEKANEAITKYRDVVKESNLGITRIITAIENQSEIHYAMPIKVMTLDAYGYDQQLAGKRKEHREKKDVRGAAFLSGFSKTDKIKPIITAVIYYGEKPWDGPRTLHDMMNLEGIPQGVINSIPDYPLMILDVRRIKDLDKFQTDVRLVFGFLHNTTDKNAMRKFVNAHASEFQHMKEDAYNVIVELTNSKDLVRMKENIVKDGGERDMCEAIRGMIEDGKIEGRKEGRKEGREDLLREKVTKKVQKGYDAPVIADMLEEDVDVIQKLMDEIKESK